VERRLPPDEMPERVKGFVDASPRCPRHSALPLYAKSVQYNGMEFIESPAFTRHLPRYLEDDGYKALQNELARNPEAGDSMPGTGGFRKMRWVDPRRGKGRRGGLRIIYYYFARDHQVWLMTLFDKNEARDLSPKQKQALRAAIGAELAARQAKRAPRKPTSGRTR